MGGYTVIDLETTGLNPGGTDRVVEFAAVYVSEDGHTEGEWTTLVNPGRDVGPTSLHGIAARDVLDAPRFADIAPHVLRSVTGRTIVAHNASFDTRFLAAEFLRAGVPLTALPLPYLCTMQLSPQFLHSRSRRLADCCAAAGIPLHNAHSALADARATAQLLECFLGSCVRPVPWLDVYIRCDCYAWPTYAGEPPAVRMLGRSSVHERRPDEWLDRIVAQLPRACDAAEDAYLEVLGRALVDRCLSVHEQEELVGLAQHLGLCRDQLHDVHQRYLVAMAAVALEDGIVTADERRDLDRVASSLGLAHVMVDAALEMATTSCGGTEIFTLQLRPGDRVVITGDTRRPREEWIELLTAAGLQHGGVTKATRVLVAADPDSLSGKAEKARAYGVPIVTEDAFEKAFDAYRSIAVV
jgi:DNA polymerase-3 subunit epsilon